tara:strand:+ start:2301 stop:3053 length:753 start_codon:yes stop_codon:yes gene_type:complete
MDWCEENENLLSEWAEKAKFYAWMHHRTSEHYFRLNNKLSLPLIIMGTISGSANFTLVGNTTSSFIFSTLIPLIIGFLNLCTVVLSASTKFLKCAELSENHAEFYRHYTKLVRNICLELSIPPTQRKPAFEICNIFRNEFDKLIGESPNIPQYIIVEFNTKFPYKKNKPEIASGFERINIYGRKKHIKSLEDKFISIRNFYRWIYYVKYKNMLPNHPLEKTPKINNRESLDSVISKESTSLHSNIINDIL